MNKLSMEDYLRQRDLTEKLPWDMIDMGFTKDYLMKELDNAQKLKHTLKCFENCKRCGVCK